MGSQICSIDPCGEPKQDTVDRIHRPNSHHSHHNEQEGALLKDSIVSSGSEHKESALVTSFVPSSNIVLSIDSIFHYQQQLGQGASCNVFQARHLQNNNIYAVKEMKKTDEVNAQLFHNEVKVLQKLVHPNILHFHDCYMDEANYYIATDYCSGGTVLEKIIKMNAFSEKKASNYITTILSAINYMHSLNIVHRDLKAQNLVFDKEGIDGQLQIIDYGDSKIVEDDEVYEEFVGTVFYIAPESGRARTGQELKASDMWSIGVITYLLVCGRPPFVGNSVKEVMQSIATTHTIRFPHRSHLTASCKDFIRKLLCHDVRRRLTAQQALKHPWISGNGASNEFFSTDYLKSLRKYNFGNKLQQILVNAILSGLDDEQQSVLSRGILALNQQLASMNGNNIVDYLLLHSSVSQVPWQQSQLSALGNRLNLDIKSPATPISYDDEEDSVYSDLFDTMNVDTILQQVEQKEFEMGVSDHDDGDDQVAPKSPILHHSPESVDAPQRSRKISVDQFRAIMSQSSKQYDVEDIVSDLDDGDGNISFNDISSYHKQINTMKGDDMEALIKQVKQEMNSPSLLEEQ